jgi:hypothetical protein
MRILSFPLFFFIGVLGCASTHGQFTYRYWEDMTENQKNDVVNDANTSRIAMQYFENKFKFTDDGKSEALLDTLISRSNLDTRGLAFYFFLFNRICLTSDGATSEILGSYCEKMLIEHPGYVTYYFSLNDAVMSRYADLLGAELYFKQENKSQIRYGYDELKSKLTVSIGNDKTLMATLQRFLQRVDLAMKKMN